MTDNEMKKRIITNKQANIFYRFDHGKPFIHIFNGRRFDRLGVNYRVSFSALVVPKI